MFIYFAYNTHNFFILKKRLEQTAELAHFLFQAAV